MASGWKFRLGLSADMSDLGELKGATGRQLQVDLNKSGSAQGSVATSLRASGLIYPWNTCVLAQYDDGVLWSGPINQRTTDMGAGRVSFSAVGWFERLMHLFLDAELSFTAEDPSVIITTLLDLAITKDARIPITIGQVNLSVPRTITYPIDQNIGQAIIDLSTLEDGVDWEVDPITRELNVLNRVGQNRPDCKWSFIVHSDGSHDARNNLANCVELVDGNNVVNDMTVRGNGNSANADDPVSKAALDGVFEERPSLPDVVDTDVLNGYAQAEIVYRSTPRVTYTMTPKPSAQANVPNIFRDFDIGDTTYLTAKRDFISVVDQAERIFGATLSIHDTGRSETLTNITTSAS